jgi:hypothetical protein
MPRIHNLQKKLRKEINKNKRGQNLRSDNSLIKWQLTNTKKPKYKLIAFHKKLKRKETKVKNETFNDWKRFTWLTSIAPH